MKAFTLIETLVVLAILAIVASILLPVLWSARAMARRTGCTSNLRQIGVAARLYREDYEAYPLRLSSLAPHYLGDPRPLVCPNDALQGRHAGTDRLEGISFLSSGVSYDYVPRWTRAIELGWWMPPPYFGPGKWDELTPLADCQWHWATAFHASWWDNDSNARGWTLILTAGGSVRKVRVEDPVAHFTPDAYR